MTSAKYYYRFWSHRFWLFNLNVFGLQVSLERAVNGSCAGSGAHDSSTKSSSASSGLSSTTVSSSGGNEAEIGTGSANQSVEMLLLRDESLSDERLADLIGTLLVSVERKIERVNIDDLVFPCPACRNIDTDDPLLGCKCGAEGCECPAAGGDQCDCGSANPNHVERNLETRSFEVAGIKHIDSDDEDEVRMGFGESRHGSRSISEK